MSSKVQSVKSSGESVTINYTDIKNSKEGNIKI